MTVGHSERCKCPTSSFPMINIIVMSYGCSIFKGLSGLHVRFLLDFFLGFNASHSRKDPFRDEGDKFEGSTFGEF